MKKVLIIGGVVLILTILALWAYLFIFGTPKEDGGIFASFGLSSDTSYTNTDSTQDNTDTSTVDTFSVTPEGSPQALRQLTTRPTAGAVFMGNSIRYTERGTGHVYDINLSSGEESLVSGTTIPKVTEALFSPDGNRVAMTSEAAEGNIITLGTITKNDNGEGIFDGVNLPGGAREVGWSNSGDEIFYLRNEQVGAVGYVYHITEKTNGQLFSIPLRDVEVLWGAQTYVYTTPSIEQVGYLYQVVNNTLTYVVPGAAGTMATAYRIATGTEALAITYVTRERLVSFTEVDGVRFDIPMGLFPDKCVTAKELYTLFCGGPLGRVAGDLPDDWYKGVVALQDGLWRVDVRGERAVLLSNLFGESGREIDIFNIGTNDDGTLVWFINKNDNTLWMFDTLVR